MTRAGFLFVELIGWDVLVGFLGATTCEGFSSSDSDSVSEEDDDSDDSDSDSLSDLTAVFVFGGSTFLFLAFSLIDDDTFMNTFSELRR